MSNGQEIECGERMTIEHVESLYGQLESALLEYDQIELIAAQVQQCDTASLQLIANVFRIIKARGHTIKWVTPSDTILNVAGILGLTDALELTQYTTQ